MTVIWSADDRDLAPIEHMTRVTRGDLIVFVLWLAGCIVAVWPLLEK